MPPKYPKYLTPDDPPFELFLRDPDEYHRILREQGRATLAEKDRLDAERAKEADRAAPQSTSQDEEGAP